MSAICFIDSEGGISLSKEVNLAIANEKEEEGDKELITFLSDAHYCGEKL